MYEYYPRLPGPRYLIVNGDDFGFTPGITQGIIAAWQHGILTSTTAMVNLPGAVERVAQAHQDHPGLPIGLHLNIVYGPPVLPPDQVPSLVDPRGQFYPLLELVRRLPQVSPDEVRRECFAQAARLVEHGVPFDHIDCHQGMPAAYGPLASVIVDLARQYAVPVRNPAPASSYGLVRLPGFGPEKEALRRLVGFAARHPWVALRLLPQLTPGAFQRQAEALANQGIRTTNWFIDAFFNRPDVDSLVALIEQLPPGVSELMCHPGRVDEALRQSGDGYVTPREGELDVLRDPRVKLALERSQVQPVDFSFLHS